MKSQLRDKLEVRIYVLFTLVIGNKNLAKNEILILFTLDIFTQLFVYFIKIKIVQVRNSNEENHREITIFCTDNKI